MTVPETEAPAADIVVPTESVETPMETEAPAEAEAPMETETPAEAEAPMETETPAEAEAPTPDASDDVAAAEGTIVDVAAANGSFDTLVAALTEAELVEVLGGEGPFTVFAPTDEAFAALPEGTLDQLLLPENREVLVQILTYHVVPGTVTSDQLESGEVATVEGSPVNVMVDEQAVMVNEANVVQADIPATNGVIHVIDRVILPPALIQ
ncbi:fasciclin [filamentous cyanobacterium CCP1]|nr:fasciclin [filamentous cyanobacterium CCP2]PSB66974.1 fasciclin [filamentous cyanobacterium CCP1]